MTKTWTANQLVAFNLIKARKLRGWTQEQAADELAKYQRGAGWSSVTWSAAERSVEGKRIRQFTADDLLAFSQAFDLPLTWWFLPPGSEEDVTILGLETVTETGDDQWVDHFGQESMLGRLFYRPPELKDRLVRTGLDRFPVVLAEEASAEELGELGLALRKAADLITGALVVAESSEKSSKRGAKRPGKGTK